MIGGCIMSGKYNMVANLFEKGVEVNENTGQSKAKYMLKSADFSLIARGLANLRGKDSGTMQDWGNKLDEYHYLRVKTNEEMTEGDIITYIRDINGDVYLNETIQFVVLGVTPTYEPFGGFMEYDILCNRAEVNVNLPNDFTLVDSTPISSTESSSMVVT
jgi:hypothetical protein